MERGRDGRPVKTEPGWERVFVVGGPLDGTIGEISPECSRLGFFVHEDEDGDFWWGYFAHEERDGFRVFRPGKPKR